MLHYLDRLAGWWLDWRTTQAMKNEPGDWQRFDLQKMEVEKNGWNVVAFAPGIVALADQAAALMNAERAENFVQFDMKPRLDRGKPDIRVTVQWAHGMSPAEKAAKLSAEVERLRIALAQATNAAIPGQGEETHE